MRRAEWTWPADISAPRSARRSVDQFSRDCGLGEDVRASIALVVTEAVTNAVLHAYQEADRPAAPEVAVSATCRNGKVEIVVRDRGGGLRPRLDSPGLGLGLGLIAQFADESDIRSGEGGGTEVLMAFRVDRKAVHA